MTFTFWIPSFPWDTLSDLNLYISLDKPMKKEEI